MERGFVDGETDLYRRALEHFDRLIISRAIDQSAGNLTRAAAKLGLSRVTLPSKLRAVRLAVEKVVTPSDSPQ